MSCHSWDCFISVYLTHLTLAKFQLWTLGFEHADHSEQLRVTDTPRHDTLGICTLGFNCHCEEKPLPSLKAITAPAAGNIWFVEQCKAPLFLPELLVHHVNIRFILNIYIKDWTGRLNCSAYATATEGRVPPTLCKYGSGYLKNSNQTRTIRIIPYEPSQRWVRPSSGLIQKTGSPGLFSLCPWSVAISLNWNILSRKETLNRLAKWLTYKFQEVPKIYQIYKAPPSSRLYK